MTRLAKIRSPSVATINQCSSRGDIVEDVGPDLVCLLRCLRADDKALFDVILFLLNSFSLNSGRGEGLQSVLDFLEVFEVKGGVGKLLLNFPEDFGSDSNQSSKPSDVHLMGIFGRGDIFDDVLSLASQPLKNVCMTFQFDKNEALDICPQVLGDCLQPPHQHKFFKEMTSL